MIVLGISYGYHCSAAAVLKDGLLVSFASEERFSYKKNDSLFPIQAINKILQECGISIENIDQVVYYEDPVLKADRIAFNAHKLLPNPTQYLQGVSGRWYQRGVLDPENYISRMLGISIDKITYVSHHFSHAASAFYASPFSDALVVTMDGVGEYETMTVWKGQGTSLRKIDAMTMPDSLGLLYGAITKFCGFEINEGEYKLMGLAAFGKPEYVDIMSSWVDLESKRLHASTEWLKVSVPNESPIDPKFIEIFGMPFDKTKDDYLDVRFANIAASIQKVFEVSISSYVSRLIQAHNIDAVCLGGGVALNCNVNGLLRREVTSKLFIPPDPGDAGSAFGAAIGWWYQSGLGTRELSPMSNAYLGTEIDESYLWQSGRAFGSLIDVETLPEEDVPKRLAEFLADGKIFGHMYGRFEKGPRALGNRSILADPRQQETKERINRSIKHRELFRPFAPAVLEEHASEYFDIPPLDEIGELAPEFFMLCTHFATELGRKAIPAAVHNDGTSRVQIVSETSNPRFSAILSAFKEITGVPVLINTSLNINGQPMASTCKSGLYTLLNSEIDGIIVGNSIVTRKN